MGFSRTILWTILTIVLCFILALGIRWYSPDKKTTDKEIPPNVAVTPANPDGNWPQFHYDQAQAGFVAGELPDKLSLAWRFKAGSAVKSSPAIVNNIVYIGSSDKHIYAIDIKTGKQVWSRLLDNEIEASPTVIENMVFIGTIAGTVYALDSGTGAERWKFSTGDKIVGGANWYKDGENHLCILTGSYDSTIYSLDALTGKAIWQYETGNYINGSPAIDDKYCVFGGCDAVIHIINLSDGKKTGELDTGAYIAASAAIRGGFVFMGNYEGEY
jgi:outer membrane protein assembly factor BamB